MRQIRVATAQFEARDGDKFYNLERIEELTKIALESGSELVAFHECSISGYTFLETYSRDQLLSIAEPVTGGESVAAIVEMAARLGIAIGAGLIEREGNLLYNAWFVATPDRGIVARHRKLHAFVSEHLTCGDRYTVFEWSGCKWGILTCYDNNLPENVRITAMMGAEIVLMPHVTGCLPSPMPGRGWVPRDVWENRELDPVRCRQEFDGPKGRQWLLRWLPTRAFENGVYAVYSNVIGIDGGTVKPGGSLILDPFGEILAECRELGDQVVAATLDPRKMEVASGQSYIRARRPDLYSLLTQPNPALGPGGRPEVWWKKHRS